MKNLACGAILLGPAENYYVAGGILKNDFKLPKASVKWTRFERRYELIEIKFFFQYLTTPLVHKKTCHPEAKDGFKFMITMI